VVSFYHKICLVVVLVELLAFSHSKLSLAKKLNVRFAQVRALFRFLSQKVNFVEATAKQIHKSDLCLRR